MVRSKGLILGSPTAGFPLLPPKKLGPGAKAEVVEERGCTQGLRLPGAPPDTARGTAPGRAAGGFAWGTQPAPRSLTRISRLTTPSVNVTAIVCRLLC